jgi:hypothetical protein
MTFIAEGIILENERVVFRVTDGSGLSGTVGLPVIEIEKPGRITNVVISPLSARGLYDAIGEYLRKTDSIRETRSQR